MAERAIDYNRGVVIRKDAKSGVDVYMYKDTPGVYLNAFGKEVPEAMAKAAGFDIARYGKAKTRNDRIAAAMDAIDKELAKPSDMKVEAQRNGIVVKCNEAGSCMVYDEDDQELAPTRLTREIALGLLDKLAPAKPAEPEPEPDAPDAPVVTFYAPAPDPELTQARKPASAKGKAQKKAKSE